MASLRTLVLGDDGSPAADTAWQWITNHRWPGWRVVAVTARMPEVGPPVAPELAELHPWDCPSPRVAREDSEIAAVEHVTAIADPRIALGEFPGADLVVVGPTGRGVLKALYLGSTAGWLIEDPTAPVVIARSARPAKRVVLGVDGSVHATRAAQVLADLPWIAGVEVVVVGVRDGRSEINHGFEEALPVLEATGATVTTHKVVGKATRVLLDEIDASDAGLVVVGSRGLTRLRRLFAGSTASALARRAPCSVLVVSAPAP
jgi:nucleotide-binding universal stress UspA family protein